MSHQSFSETTGVWCPRKEIHIFASVCGWQRDGSVPSVAHSVSRFRAGKPHREVTPGVRGSDASCEKLARPKKRWKTARKAIGAIVARTGAEKLA
jgi:hypothetical protein